MVQFYPWYNLVFSFVLYYHTPEQKKIPICSKEFSFTGLDVTLIVAIALLSETNKRHSIQFLSRLISRKPLKFLGK